MIFFKNRKTEKKDTYFGDDLTADDKLFYILNIGNHEYRKNRKYILDEIVFRLECGHPIKNIASFIHDFVYKTWENKISKRKLTRWIKETYKYKIEAIIARGGFRKK